MQDDPTQPRPLKSVNEHLQHHYVFRTLFPDILKAELYEDAHSLKLPPLPVLRIPLESELPAVLVQNTDPLDAASKDWIFQGDGTTVCLINWGNPYTPGGRWKRCRTTGDPLLGPEESIARRTTLVCSLEPLARSAYPLVSPRNSIYSPNVRVWANANEHLLEMRAFNIAVVTVGAAARASFEPLVSLHLATEPSTGDSFSTGSSNNTVSNEHDEHDANLQQESKSKTDDSETANKGTTNARAKARSDPVAKTLTNLSLARVEDLLRSAFKTAALWKHDTVVIGAMGCDVLEYPAHAVANAMAKVLGEKDLAYRFSKVIVAIPGSDGLATANRAAFRTAFFTWGWL